MEALAFIIILAIRAGIGYLIGKNRKIGEGWGALLGAVLGLVGWIIAACSKKNSTPDFTNIN